MANSPKIESSDFSTASGVELTAQQKLFTGSVLDLFAGKATLEKLRLWKDDAIFEDPITVAKGRAEFEPQWYGLKTAFSSIQPLKQLVTSSGNPITLDMKTTYKVKGIGTEHTIESTVLIHVDEAEGKITHVQDKWDGKLPEGAIANAFRRLNAVSVPKMVSVPKSDAEEAAK
ncbi:MAG: hypothetical protein M1814_001475 [Vezdaea aestivalis]|nr:MAG: hypothetical protein M1814_001475 [Vezdaea aestivalis]